eukprot:3414102-Prymnesium_polylepis.2
MPGVGLSVRIVFFFFFFELEISTRPPPATTHERHLSTRTGAPSADAAPRASAPDAVLASKKATIASRAPSNCSPKARGSGSSGSGGSSASCASSASSGRLSVSGVACVPGSSCARTPLQPCRAADRAGLSSIVSSSNCTMSVRSAR